MKFEMYRERGGIRWRLRSGNGKVICRSEVIFRRVRNCRDSIELVRKAVWFSATIADLTSGEVCILRQSPNKSKKIAKRRR